MKNCSSGRVMQQRRLSAAMAGLGQLQWFFGNVYEAVVDIPSSLRMRTRAASHGYWVPEAHSATISRRHP